jgi:hypothetical protein
MLERERYSIVWKEADEALAARFHVPGYRGFLPFFISGNSLDLLEAGDSVELTEWQLLAGILYGLDEFDNHAKPWHKAEDRHTLTYLLDVMRNGFDFADPEKMLLDVAYKLRETNGNKASRTVLSTGLGLIPFSSKIRSDLICDTWAIAAEMNDPSMLELIPSLVMETTLTELIHAAKEVICYYGLCSMVLLDYAPEEIENYLNEFIYPNVELRSLKVKIKDLLENTTSFTVGDLRVT